MRYICSIWAHFTRVAPWAGPEYNPVGWYANHHYVLFPVSLVLLWQVCCVQGPAQATFSCLGQILFREGGSSKNIKGNGVESDFFDSSSRVYKNLNDKLNIRRFIGDIVDKLVYVWIGFMFEFYGEFYQLPRIDSNLNIMM